MIFGGMRVIVDERIGTKLVYRKWWQLWKPKFTYVNVGDHPPFYRVGNSIVTNSLGYARLREYTTDFKRRDLSEIRGALDTGS